MNILSTLIPDLIQSRWNNIKLTLLKTYTVSKRYKVCSELNILDSILFNSLIIQVDGKKQVRMRRERIVNNSDPNLRKT